MFCYLQLPICASNGNCEIDYKTRANCSWCRFQKCLAVGMKPEMIEYDVLIRDSSSRKNWKFSSCSDPYRRRPYNRRTGTSGDNKSGQDLRRTERTVTRHKDVLNPLNFVKQPTLQPAILTSLKPVTNRCMWMKTKQSSPLKVKLLDTFCAPGHTHRFVIEVEVENGLIRETHFNFDHLLMNQPSVNPNSNDVSSKLVLKSRYDEQSFEKRTRILGHAFDVAVTNVQNKNTAIMEFMTRDLWNHMAQVFSAIHHLLRMTQIFYHQPHPSSEINIEHGVVKKTLILNQTMDNNAIVVTSAVETFDSFRQLLQEDQLILLKEGMTGVVFIFTPYIFDDDHKSFTFSALNHELLLGLHAEGLWVEDMTKNMSQAYTQLVSDIPVFLRKDAFFICILCLIFFFRDTPGISCSKPLQTQRSILTQLLDKYICGKVRSKEWDMDYNQVHQCIREIFRKATNFTKGHVYEKLSSERQKIWDSEGKMIKNRYLWIHRLPSSSLDFKVLDLNINPCIERKVHIEVTINDGIVAGTLLTLEDLISRNNYMRSRTNDINSIELRCRDGNRETFRLLRAELVSSNVEVTSTLSGTSSVINEVSDNLWQKLTEVIEAGTFLQKTFYAMITELPENALSPDVKHLSLTITWQSVIRSITQSFDMISSFASLPKGDQDLLRKEATTESLILQMVASFDKDTGSFVHIGIHSHITLCTRMKIFDSDVVSAEATFYQSLHSLTYEFDDNLRKDDVAITLLSMLCLFKERSGVSSRQFIRNERSFFLQLLDKYITSKTNSMEWLTSYDSVWNSIHRDMARVSSLKSLFENMSIQLL